MKPELNRRDVLMAAAAGSSLLLGGGLLGCSRREPAAAAGIKPELAYRFPEKFIWGAGTSGLQHEGSPLADGAGESSMYRWAHATKVKTAKPDWFTPPNESFDVTSDFYKRFVSDIQLMRELNLRAYNFEVYWPRIFPQGTGRVNEAGLEFYDRLVDEFLKAGIVPLCNLYVFDHPAALQDRGGWLNRDMAQWFADYATVLYKRFGDRVEYWTTICELPLVDPYLSGVIVPGKAGKEDEGAFPRALHHLLLGQGLAVQAFRASGAKGEIGNQPNWTHFKPASDKEEDVAATKLAHAQTNLLYLDPQLLGHYPRELEGWPTDAIKSGDLATISAPIDFFGVDYYNDQTVTHDASEKGGPLQFRTVEHEGNAEGMRQSLLDIHERYKKPIFILEIGHAVPDKVENGKVNDPARIAYLGDVISGMHKAMGEGVDVRACFIWSLFDGWEFGFGLSRLYGLVHVDPVTQERIVKASGYWYRDLIAANGYNLPAGNAMLSSP